MFNTIDTDGRPLTLEPVVRPVISLKLGLNRGSSLDRALRVAGEQRPAAQALAKLAPYDAVQMDRSILTEGLAAIQPSSNRDALLFAPVSFSTLDAARSRREALALLTEAQARLGGRLVLEITALDSGLPPSRLIDVLTAVRPVCRTVYARLRPERKAIMALTDCALAGAAIEASDLADPEDADALTRIRLVLRAIGPRLLIHNLRTMAAINAARAAGITYASLDIARLGGRA
jgi:hypothetical protein